MNTERVAVAFSKVSANSMVNVQEVPADNMEKIRKSGLPKFIQQLIALAGLVAFSPILLLTALFIRLESPGDAIFTQTRVGLKGRRFKIYKFRSMRLSTDPKYIDIRQLKADREGVCAKLFKDPRITRIGRFIRKSSIDELPQLINVLKGDMLLIGPRPALPQETDIYTKKAFGRLGSIPGLTGLWQVSGRADTTFDEQVELDLRYAKQRSLFEDIRILWMTVPAVIFGKGAY